MKKSKSFESRPFSLELLSDLKRKIQVRNWIIAALSCAVVALACALIAK